MRLYLTAKTNIPEVYIDFIEVRLKNGEVVSLNWDESDICRTDTGFEARYKGVCFGEEYANGKISALEGLEISDIGLYFESSGSFEFQIAEIEFEDDDKTLSFKHPVIPENCSGFAAIQKELKPSLGEQIQAASACVEDPRSSEKPPEKETTPER